MRSWPAGVLVCAVVLAVVARAPARPISRKLVVGNVGHYRDGAGRLWVFGEVANRGSGAAADVGVAVFLASKKGRRLARGVALKTSRNVLRVGEKAVWVARMTSTPTSWAGVTTETAEQLGRAAALTQDYRGFAVRNVKLAPGRLSGTVVNTGSKQAKIGAVVIAFYDSRRQLVFATDEALVRRRIVPAKKRAAFRTAVAVRKKPARIVATVRASTAGKSGFYLP